MDDSSGRPTTAQRWCFAGILFVAFLIRLFHFDAALLDCMSIKQIYQAQRARHIAGPPFALFTNIFDFMTEEGEPLNLAEEFPLFPALVAVCYRIFGEHEWLGRLMSILATLVAICALYDLVRLELGRRLALLSAMFFSLTPLLLAYGRAFQPDVAMVACMLLAACWYQRYLQQPCFKWWVLTLVAGILAGLFKYYGLMVLLPMAIMTYCRYGFQWRATVAWIGLVCGIFVPMGLWMGFIFLKSHNPAQTGTYYIFQLPGLMFQTMLFERFLDRFLYKDCGPVLMVFVFIGVWAVYRRGAISVNLTAWTIMGVLFYFLLGPMLRYHVYYEMMMLPAAAIWGAIGWTHLWQRPGRGAYYLSGVVVALMAIIHSPLVMTSNFVLENGIYQMAQRIKEYGDAGSRIVVAGPLCGVGVVHYAHRQGWTWWGPVPKEWEARIDNYHKDGADLMLITLDDKAPESERLAYRQITAHWPVLDHGTGIWDTRMHPYEFYILDLKSKSSKIAQLAASDGQLK